jgi:hypothetical protein
MLMLMPVPWEEGRGEQFSATLHSFSVDETYLNERTNERNSDMPDHKQANKQASEYRRTCCRSQTKGSDTPLDDGIYRTSPR